MGILGQGTVVVDGQRTTAPPSAAFLPMNFGVQTTGVPNVSPAVPPYAVGATGGGAVAGGTGASSVNGYGTADNNAAVATVAANNPFSIKVSPVWWAVGALIGGVLLLQAISWHDVVGAHAGGKLGSAHADASAGA